MTKHVKARIEEKNWKMKQLLVNLDINLICHSLKWMENDGTAVIFVFYLQFITQVGAK